ncbi:MAG: GNAT family N-acetyltransferase [Geobacteraceae bacterium]|nr:GNAT family N-acetyltransferase [Geobacteraceae bacterium]
MSMRFSIEKLCSDHAIDGFDCGSQELNRFLVRYALVNQQACSSQTYVGLADLSIVGFYSLAVGQVNYEDSPQRLIRGLAQHPVPIMLLARLAVSNKWQKRVIGAALLKDAMRRTMQAADIAGIRAFAVHVKDETAQQFYAHFDFIPSPTDPYHMFLLLKDIRRMIGE